MIQGETNDKDLILNHTYILGRNISNYGDNDMELFDILVRQREASLGILYMERGPYTRSGAL